MHNVTDKVADRFWYFSNVNISQNQICPRFKWTIFCWTFRTWSIYLSANKHKIVGKQCNYIKVFGLEKNLFPNFEIIFVQIQKVFIKLVKSVFWRRISSNDSPKFQIVFVQINTITFNRCLCVVNAEAVRLLEGVGKWNRHCVLNSVQAKKCPQISWLFSNFYISFHIFKQNPQISWLFKVYTFS